MTPVAQRKLDIDIVDTIRGHGVELKRFGHVYKAACPFHSEKDPSFVVYPDSNRFQCVGCHESGDVIDFMQRFHGLDFKGALNHLGISQGFLTRANKREIAEANKKRQRRRELIGFFREWERAAVHHYSMLVRATSKAMTELTPANFDEYADVLQPLATWEYWLDTLTFGDDSKKFALFQEHRKNGIKLIRRNQLFRPDFDFKQWLKETT